MLTTNAFRALARWFSCCVGVNCVTIYITLVAQGRMATSRAVRLHIWKLRLHLKTTIVF